MDPSLEAFFIADANRPVQAQTGFTVLPNYSFNDNPSVSAFLIPGGFGTRQEIYNERLHQYILSLPPKTLLTSVCTGSWIYGHMGLSDNLVATSRKEPDKAESNPPGMVPTDRLKVLAPACKVSLKRVVDTGRIVTAGGITAGMEMGFHLLRKAGYEENFISEVARIMEYSKAYEGYRDDLEKAL
jgi:transcriptional regulator GlxA family with amidase domain